MAALSGMTGFARTEGAADWGSWVWEAKSVNGRGLDVRVSVPSGFEVLDRLVKTEAGKRFKRGSLQISLRLETGDAGSVIVNQSALDTVLATYEATSGETATGTVLAVLMTAKGVVETGSNSTRDIAGREGVVEQMAAAANALLDALGQSRLDEGAAMKTLLVGIVSEMEATSIQAGQHAADHPARLKARLESQLAELGATGAVDADRLAAEAALAAAKADVREELDRLAGHFQTARAHLEAGSPTGRQLDFLSQELSREANTLCSKSVSLDLTNAGLALKGLVDQFKEQAANVE